MAVRPISIHEGAGAPAFQLLFLSEGFLASSEQEFVDHCHVLTASLLTIPPFNFAASRIAVSASFNASAEEGIGQTPRNTAFGFHLLTTQDSVTRRPSTIIAAVRNIGPIELGPGVQSLYPLNGGDIWIEPGTRGFRAICVVIKHAGRSATLKTTYTAQELDDPADRNDPNLLGLLPFIAVSMWPRLPASQPRYVNGDAAAAAVLARELGALMGLGYESERAGPEFETYPGASLPASTESPYPNLTADRFLRRPDRTIDLRRLKWRGLITLGRRNFRGGPVELDHPALTVPDDTPLKEVARYEPVLAEMRRRVVVLRHPTSASTPGDTSALVDVRYDTLGRIRIRLDDVHLIEGGGGFRRGVYRSSVECLMRFEGSDGTTAAGLERRITPYCKVCLSYLRTQLTTLRDIQFKGIRIIRGPANAYAMTIESRLASALETYIKGQPLQPVIDTGNGMICVEATIYRYETFFRRKAHWRPTTPIDIASGWYTTRIKFPYGSSSGIRMWKIWNTWPNFLRDKHAARAAHHMPPPALRLEYGLGAPGAIAFAGFGCIANRMRIETRTVDGTEYSYHLADNLTDADLELLPPGTVLQIWQTEEGYRNLIEYIAGIGPRRTDEDLQLNPIVSGHSLYYMGRDTSGPSIVHLVADQNRVKITDRFADFLTDWQSYYRMRIAAQWYEAANIPAVRRR